MSDELWAKAEAAVADFGHQLDTHIETDFLVHSYLRTMPFELYIHVTYGNHQDVVRGTYWWRKQMVEAVHRQLEKYESEWAKASRVDRSTTHVTHAWRMLFGGDGWPEMPGRCYLCDCMIYDPEALVICENTPGPGCISLRDCQGGELSLVEEL